MNVATNIYSLCHTEIFIVMNSVFKHFYIALWKSTVVTVGGLNDATNTVANFNEWQIIINVI